MGLYTLNCIYQCSWSGRLAASKAYIYIYIDIYISGEVFLRLVAFCSVALSESDVPSVSVMDLYPFQGEEGWLLVDSEMP